MIWSEAIPGVVLEVAFWWMGVENSETSIEGLGDLSLEVSNKLRTLAILAILAEASTDGFVHSCTRAGRARKLYLERLKNDGIDRDHHLVSGCYEPLLDAIAAGDMALVHEIDELSPTDFRSPDEYEDDYCYAQILYRLCRDPAPEAEFEPLLKQFEAYLDGDDNPRLLVCRALVERDEASFAQAFEDFLMNLSQVIKEKIDGGTQVEDVHTIAQRHISIEGLALLRIANQRGIRTESDYLYCPSLARLPASRPCPSP
jgi:hypothetical protein